MMKMRRINLLHLIKKLNVLFTTFGLQKCESDLKLSRVIVLKCLRWTTCEGHPGLKRFKTYSFLFTRSALGISEHLPFSSRHKRAFSKALFLANKNKLAKLYWISIFNVHRCFTLHPVIDTTTITSGFEGSLYRLAISSWSLFQVTLSFTKRIKFLQENWSAKWKWHISGATGPNGSLAYTRYLDDLYAIRQEGLYWKLCLLLYSLPLSNRRETFDALKDAVFQSWNTEYGDKQPIHSRLAFLSDKSGKTRVIAIIDILSQSCLKVVHQRCNQVLHRLETDGTFDQDKARQKVKKWTECRKTFISSIDLTAVTDRLPVLYQVLVLIGTRILTPLQGLAWYLVVVRRSFLVRTKKGPKYVRYAVGQPMGALSSWPVMAISHHILVLWAYKLAYPSRTRNFKGYVILGDDLVIKDKLASEKYLWLISALGVEFSKEKSFFSIGLAEFAKSLFIRGNDLTPFPLRPLIFEKHTVVTNIQVVLTECFKRKFKTTLATIVGISPARWRSLVEITALSPLSPTSVLDVSSRKDNWIFFSFLLIERIKYFSRLNTVRISTHAFAINDPGKSGKRLASPFLQIGTDNGERYPVRRLRDTKRLVDPIPVLGVGWISYCSQSWPNGLPLLGDRKMIPGPTWQNEFDDIIVRSSLLRLEKLFPGYFTVRCVGKQVGK
jgi:hypothetical protein